MTFVLQQGAEDAVAPQHTPLPISTSVQLNKYSISRLLSATTLTLLAPQSLFALPPSNSTGHGTVPLVHLYSEHIRGISSSSQGNFL